MKNRSWCKVSLFGHTELYGLASKTEFLGEPFLKVLTYGADGLESEHIVSPKAIFTVEASTEEVCRDIAKPIATRYPRVLTARHRDDDDDDDDERRVGYYDDDDDSDGDEVGCRADSCGDGDGGDAGDGP